MKLANDALKRSGWAKPEAATKLAEALHELGVDEHYAELALRQGPTAVAHLVEHRAGKSAQWAAKARDLIRGGAAQGSLPRSVGAPVGAGARFKLELMSGKISVPGTVGFYLEKDDYGAFSNFSKHPFTVRSPSGEALTAPTSEHFFQAMKFWTTDPSYARKIVDAESPKVAAKLGRSRDTPMRKDWEAVKEDAMRVAVAHKFTQHPELTELLLSTGANSIVENAPHDLYWGNAWELGGIGKNRLGVILEEVRSAIADDALEAYCGPKLKRVFEGAA